MIGQGLAALAIALLVIFCTPYGWIGLGIVWFTIYEIYKLKIENKK